MNFKKKIKKIIPNELHFFLAEIKNLFIGGYRRSYYSQFGEDLILGQIFGKESSGFYVDVGAHHPFRYSNTCLLYKKGWRGINVEPNSYLIKIFNFFRRRDINLGIGVGSCDSLADYYYLSDPAFNTFSKEQMEESLRKNKWLKLRKKRKIPVFTLRTIFKNYLPDGINIDLLNIDVEGLDLDVLKTNNWAEFRPRVIIVEASDFNWENPNGNNIFEYLKALGYQLKTVAGCSLFFVLSEG